MPSKKGSYILKTEKTPIKRMLPPNGWIVTQIDYDGKEIILKPFWWEAEKSLNKWMPL